MAYKKNNRKSNSSKKKNKRNSRDKILTQFAYNYGQITRGLGNPDSKIASAFERGKAVPEQRKKKSLF